ncbi:MAG: hypothetical protein ACK5IJ_04925 [Mangrovibacterium sp.]
MEHFHLAGMFYYLIEETHGNASLSLHIPQRQFVGHYTKVDEIVKANIDNTLQELCNSLENTFKNRFK